MPVVVKVELNGVEIARAKACNLSRLDGISDYGVSTSETAAPDLGIEGLDFDHTVKRHERNQSVWALVAKIASFASMMDQHRPHKKRGA